jgi:hypothetical protein
MDSFPRRGGKAGIGACRLEALFPTCVLRISRLFSMSFRGEAEESFLGSILPDGLNVLNDLNTLNTFSFQ